MTAQIFVCVTVTQIVSASLSRRAGTAAGLAAISPEVSSNVSR
jgi:hypothetical protein